MASRKPKSNLTSSERDYQARQREAEELARRERNAFRLWHIQDLACRLRLDVRAELTNALTGPRVELRIECNDYTEVEDEYVRDGELVEYLSVYNSDAEFDYVEKVLRIEQELRNAAEEEARKRDELLQTLSEEQRRLLGYPNWSKKK